MTTADAGAVAGNSPLGGEPGHRYVELSSITKRFGPTLALDGASLSVGRGEVHALFGGNGSGKSTMIKIMAGVYKADSDGEIRVGETVAPTGQWSPAAARAAGLRFVHQDLGLFPGLSVAENLAIGNGFSLDPVGRIRWSQVRAQARAVLDRLEIPVGVTRLVGDLRRGDQALVAIARALQDEDIAGRGVLVLDEPTASLPEHEVVGLMQALRRFAALGTAVVYVSHRVEEVQEIADTITVLRDGRDILTTPAKSVTKGELADAITGAPAGGTAPTAGPAPGAADAGPVLRVAGLTGGPLRGVDLAVGRGEIVGIAGLLGSGRSSVLRALYGLLDGAEGEISLQGRPLRADSPARAMEAGIGYLPEDRAEAGFFDDSVAENLSVSRTRSYWRGGRFRVQQEQGDARAAIERFRIRCESPRQLLSALSGGNQQKVLVARVLLRNPDIVLLDEPTQGVDINAKAEIWAILRQQIAESGISVLAVSSDFEELAEYADRVLILARGRVVGQVPGPGMTGEMLARAAYGDEEKVGQ